HLLRPTGCSRIRLTFFCNGLTVRHPRRVPRESVAVKKVSYPLVATFMLAFMALVATSNQAIAAVGRTPGTFVVSSSGTATYTIPIWTPPGPHGVQPEVALVYNSGQGNGYLGVGWSLSGLSSIYRCNQTFAQNPTPAPVTLTASDALCMDGQQLRLASGTYG